MDNIPENLGEISEIEMALNIANKINMTGEELEIVYRRGMMLQDEKGRITYAEQQGRLKEAIALIMRQLKKRFGEIPVIISSQIEGLVLSDLESLTEDIFDFNSLEDLENCLKKH